MKYSLFLLLAVLPAFPLGGYESHFLESQRHPLCVKSPMVVNEIVFNEYRIIISSAGDQSCETLDIFKDYKLAYHDEEIGGHYYTGDSPGEVTNAFVSLSGDDNILVISKWTGGAHCCFSLYLFELGREFRSIAHIDGGNFLPYLEDLDRDEIPEIRVTDDFLAYQLSSFADSATANVVLRYSDGAYRIAPELMTQGEPDSQVLNQRIQSWDTEFKNPESGRFPPPDYIQTITDLFFTGNSSVALKILRGAWPDGVSGRDEFIEQYLGLLNESRYFNEFERQRTN